MRIALITSIIALCLSSCGPAVAEAPGASNATQCFAAFNYAAYIFKVGHEPEREKMMLARALYELDRAKLAGSADTLVDAKSFIKAHGHDDKVMDALFLKCSKDQNASSGFRAELPKLLMRAQVQLLPRF